MGQECEDATFLRQSGHRQVRFVNHFDDGMHAGASGDATAQQLLRQAPSLRVNRHSLHVSTLCRTSTASPVIEPLADR